MNSRCHTLYSGSLLIVMFSFGYLDGISQPAVQGVDITINKGQDLVKPGVILLGRDGDSVSNRPSWAQDGSFLAFRYLSQLVPEFDAFKGATAQALGLDEELLGARLTGRWKSGMMTFKLSHRIVNVQG